MIDEDLIADASAALHELSRGPNKKRSDPAIKKDRGKIRFAIYKKLSSRYGFTLVSSTQAVCAHRVLLPPLAELMVKAAFPGDSPIVFTSFIA